MTAPQQPAKITSRDILDALEAHYRPPGIDGGEILITEAQAPGSQRRADLVRIGMWQSRGTGIDVHEINVSRGDWLRELAEPAKAEAWWPYCNRFWVTTPPGVVDLAELPDGWGLMELPPAGRRRFKVRVKATTRTDIRLTVPLIVELLRRCDNRRLQQITRLQQDHRDEIYRAEQAARTRAAEAGPPPDLRRKLDLLSRVEAAMGMQLAEYPDWNRDGHLPEQVTPAELAAYLADARAHVAVQRRADDVTEQERRLRNAAQAVVRDLAKPAPVIPQPRPVP